MKSKIDIKIIFESSLIDKKNYDRKKSNNHLDCTVVYIHPYTFRRKCPIEKNHAEHLKSIIRFPHRMFYLRMMLVRIYYVPTIIFMKSKKPKVLRLFFFN